MHVRSDLSPSEILPQSLMKGTTLFSSFLSLPGSIQYSCNPWLARSESGNAQSVIGADICLHASGVSIIPPPTVWQTLNDINGTVDSTAPTSDTVQVTRDTNLR
ncbi:hypothetical protein D9619_001323 [Psilocybe cf. subviscida]|uniref:Uncharacterized protein n=1 Tax=Psilocybe cf. subviscida TaxID=2480587 RepID=A0A8H5BFW5_9AGAR|nr:hypothetical protein D9619_001323 [Psilocybe cf. subviscida]